MTSPFSVIIPWRGRPELARTLKHNAPWFARSAREVIVVNCGGDPDEAAMLMQGRDVPGLRQVLLPADSFSRALAGNVGAWCGAGPFLFFLDADVVLRSDIFAEAGDLLTRRRCFVKIRTVRETRPRIDARTRFLKEQVNAWRLVSKEGQRAVFHFYSRGDGSRCGSGLMLLKKEDLLRVGGFNSGLEGWGFEDIDLQIRLQFVMKLRGISTGETLHLTHGDEVRDVTASSRQENYHRNMMACFENYSQHQMLGTYARDIETWQGRLHEVAPPHHVASDAAV